MNDDTHTLADTLRNLMLGEIDASDLAIKRIETFEEAGVLTRNAGLVVKLESGTAFQLTIVRSR